ncbi:MAG TPA: MraY family glycosyltransferase [Spirochaetia bacterium]|nr:MraY family glycosyltransferase [Spirochaetia bacterium]
MVVALTGAGVLALVISTVVTPLVIRASHRRQWFDMPNERKIHTSPVPRLGGIGMFLAFVLSALAVPILLPVAAPGPWPVHYDFRFVPVFAAFAMVHGLGLLDDFHNLNPLLKLILQIVAAALVTLGGFTVSVVNIPSVGPVSLGIFSWPITIFLIIAISNAINLVDGLVGLAGGISGIAALALGISAYLQLAAAPALMAFALLGAILGFLLFNYPPARIFMGDSGALFLGFTLAVIPLLKGPGSTSLGELLAPATVLAVPILDVVAAIVRRVREKRPIYSPDKEHIHHKLLGLGLKDTKILSVIYGFCAYVAVASVVAIFLPRVQALILFGFVWATSILAYVVLTNLTQKRRLMREAGEARLRGRPT